MSKKILLPGLFIVMLVLAFAYIPAKKDSAATPQNFEKEIVETKVEKGIHFIEEDWNNALAEAKKQKKLIFFDAYTSWCGPCKLLKRNTFPDKNAGDFFNKNFINVAVDMEKGDGPALAQQYGVNAYPTLIIADAEGKLVTYTQGYMKPKQLIEFGAFGLKQHGTSHK